MRSIEHFSTLSNRSFVMEQREHLRIQIPLLVELTHPAVGSIQCTARDVSEEEGAAAEEAAS